MRFTLFDFLASLATRRLHGRAEGVVYSQDMRTGEGVIICPDLDSPVVFGTRALRRAGIRLYPTDRVSCRLVERRDGRVEARRLRLLPRTRP